MRVSLLFYFMFINACSTSVPLAPKPFSNQLTIFSHAGHQFAAKVVKGELLVKVPCCQTYIADDDFKALMLEAVELRMGCVTEAPMFTDGWVGEWQMRARFAC